MYNTLTMKALQFIVPELNTTDCCNSNLNKSICENKVDAHLNNLCKYKTSVVTTFDITNTTTTTPQSCPIITETVCITTSSTQLVTDYATSNLSIASIQPMERQSLGNLAANTLPVLILGALLALSILLLLIVTTGWVCTCVSMKKRKVKKSSCFVQSRYYNIKVNQCIVV